MKVVTAIAVTISAVTTISIVVATSVVKKSSLFHQLEIYPFDNIQITDYLRRRVNVPCSYFNQSGDDIHGGVCRQWGRYRNSQGTYSYGYYIYFDAGDRYWLLESDVHKYLES